MGGVIVLAVALGLFEGSGFGVNVIELRLLVLGSLVMVLG